MIDTEPSRTTGHFELGPDGIEEEPDVAGAEIEELQWASAVGEVSTAVRDTGSWAVDAQQAMGCEAHMLLIVQAGVYNMALVIQG